MMEWFRWYHGTVTDPKWRVVAKRAGCTVGEVISVWATILEDASANATERGELHGWCSEDIAALLDMEPAQVDAIREAMQGKVLEGDKVPAWDRRQPKREDGSAERARAWREKKRAEKEREQPQPNAPERKRTLDKSREEEREQNNGAKAPAAGPPNGKPVQANGDAVHAARSDAAPLIRTHVWQGKRPPATAGAGWDMKRDLSIWNELVKQFSPAELNGAIGVCRLALAEELPPERPITMAYFARDGTRDRMSRCVAYWRRLESQKLARERNPMALIGETATEVARAATG